MSGISRSRTTSKNDSMSMAASPITHVQMDGLVSLKIIKHCTEEGTGGDLVQVGGNVRRDIEPIFYRYKKLAHGESIFLPYFFRAFYWDWWSTIDWKLPTVSPSHVMRATRKERILTR